MEQYTEKLNELNSHFLDVVEAVLESGIPKDIQVAKIQAELNKLNKKKCKLIEDIPINILAGDLPF